MAARNSFALFRRIASEAEFSHASLRIHDVVIAIVAVSAALSHSTVLAHESAYFEELPTVLTVSRLPQPLNDAPGAVTVIEGDFIRATGYRDLARIFRLVPGMQVGQERGNASWVTYHGQGNNFSGEGQLQVLIDGRSVYSTGAYGGVNWAALPLSIDEIERIEVVRGANGVTYGANAFLGVINIITRHSSQDAGWRAKTSAGTAGVADLMISGNGSAERLSWRATAGFTKDDGFSGLNDSRRGVMASLRMDYRLSAIDELMLRLAGGDTKWGEGYPRTFIESNRERELRNFNSTLHLKWNRALSAEEELSFQYYRIKERLREDWTVVFSPPLWPTVIELPFDRGRRTVRDQIEFQSRSAPSDSTKLVWGGEAFHETFHSVSIFAGGVPEPVTMWRAFGNVDWQFAPNWRTNLGAAYERYTGEQPHLSPRAFVNWQVAPRHTLRAGYARAFDQRRVTEKDSDVQVRDPQTHMLLVHQFIPNPDLRQARMDSHELSYLGRFRTWNAMLDVRLFNERTKGLPVLRQVTSGLSAALPDLASNQSFNSSKDAVIRGLEYQLRASPWNGSQWIFNHLVMDRTRGDPDSIVLGAPYTASLSWLQTWGGGWSTTLTALRMGPMSPPVHYMPAYTYGARAYTTYDARIAYVTSVARSKVELSLNAINLGSRHQEQPDRAVQGYLSTFGEHGPANVVSPMVYFTLAVDL